MFLSQSFVYGGEMACQAIRCWTLSKLIGAYLDLAIAYVLLGCSTVAYFVANFIGFFGFSLPCPCNGVISKQNPDHCLQKLLVDCPTDKISCVQLSVKSRLPFDSVLGRNEDCQLSFKVVRENMLEKGVIELEGEASCSSVSAAKTSQAENANIDSQRKNEGLALAEEGKFDVKGKAVARSRRQRCNLRRRKRSSTDHTKLTSNSSYDNLRSSAPIVPLSNYGNSHTGKESSDSYVALDSHDVIEPLYIMELDHKSLLSFGSNVVDKDVSPLGSQRNDLGQHFEHDCHLENAVKLLEQALKEERVARAALFCDLEKERTAAATAADEAMAMILRLQEEKAAIELEARQYERILEEKSTYDAEEMDILKEIVVRREMEKHFLEKEVESYKKMLEEKEQLKEDACYLEDIQEENLLVLGETERLVIHQQLDSTRSTGTMTTGQNAGQDDNSTVEINEEFQKKNILPGTEEYNSSTSHDHRYVEKSVVLIGEVKSDTETESFEQFDGKDPGENIDVQELHLHDIHVIGDICTSHNKDAAESSMTHDEPSEALEIKRADEPRSSLPPLSSSTYENKVSELRRHSIASVDHERQKLNNEVGLLREKLRNIQADRQKLNFPLEHRDKGETELLLLEDIGNLLQEIKQLTEPQKTMLRTSLPLLGSKDASKKRRCRSASVEHHQICSMLELCHFKARPGKYWRDSGWAYWVWA
ncbi:hypothetical protein V2J09_014355 [Rumex salicifolius]